MFGQLPQLHVLHALVLNYFALTVRLLMFDVLDLGYSIHLLD